MHSLRIIALIIASVSVTDVAAKHVPGHETNVILLYCVIDTSVTPTKIVVEAVSNNLTRHPLPQIMKGAQCAEALHQYFTAGFHLINRDTATSLFVLTREDEAIVEH
jgi:hypothetical protein